MFLTEKQICGIHGSFADIRSFCRIRYITNDPNGEIMKRFFSSIADYIRETDKLLIILCLCASLYGSVIILSATIIGSGYQRFIVQCIGTLLGLVVAVIVSLIDYKYLIKYWYICGGLGVGLVLLTFVIGFAPAGTDDKAWIALPFGQSFQPSELLKIAFVITFSTHLSYLKNEKRSSFFNVMLLCLHGAAPVLLIHRQGDDGTALVLFFIFLTMMFAAGIKLRYFAALGGLVLAAVPLAWFFVMNSDQKDRVLALIYPDQYAAAIYQQARGELAIGSGGFFGTGLFKGPCVQGGLIPLGFNDFIFASAGEELGFFGCLLIIALLTAICVRILNVSKKSRDESGKLLCSGIFAMFAAQSIINIGMVLSFLPVIGITLPFFSAGGTSVVTLYLGIGIVLSVYKHRNMRPLLLRD